jgi:hypothetical protein
VGTARELGDDAAEDLVHVLRQDGEARELTLDEDGRRRLIAGGFDAEDDLSHDDSGVAG